MNIFGEIFLWLYQHVIILNILVALTIIFFQRREPRAAWAWLFAIIFIPVLGVCFFLIFGQDYRKSKMFRVKEADDALSYPVKNQEEVLGKYARTMSDSMTRDYGDLVMYNLKAGQSVLTFHNSISIFTDGIKKFNDLIEEIKKAKRFIHIQYYIIKNDELFDRISAELKKKAQDGVEVRILCDGMGARFMPKRKWKELKEAGIRIGVFFPAALGRINLRINYRNHRKIVVIDGDIGYTGGFNIGREYIDKDKYFGHWRDIHFKIRGESVEALEARFALDWNYATHENLFTSFEYFIPSAGVPVPDDVCEMQIITSGPDSATLQIRDNYIELFNKAREHIYITTPYFIPDEAVMSALLIAVKSGIDVRLMIPCKPDHPFVYWATLSWAGSLLLAGGRVYAYTGGFLHAKSVMVDGRTSCAGTANMDIRSFELNFEVNAIIYDEETTYELENGFIYDMQNNCEELTKEKYAARNALVRFREQLFRLLSPLL